MKFIPAIFLLVLIGAGCATQTTTPSAVQTQNINVEQPLGTKKFSSSECTDLGGEIVNTLSEDPATKGTILGDITDLRCPCVCVKK